MKFNFFVGCREVNHFSGLCFKVWKPCIWTGTQLQKLFWSLSSHLATIRYAMIILHSGLLGYTQSPQSFGDFFSFLYFNVDFHLIWDDVSWSGWLYWKDWLMYIYFPFVMLRLGKWSRDWFHCKLLYGLWLYKTGRA